MPARSVLCHKGKERRLYTYEPTGNGLFTWGAIAGNGVESSFGVWPSISTGTPLFYSPRALDTR